MSSPTHIITTGKIVAENGESFPDDVYEETTKAVGSQQWVADQWAQGMLPLHETGSPGYRSGRDPGERSACVLRSSTGNFKGYQFTDGSGLLQHYSTIEAIRSREGLIVGNIECWSRGWAHCSKPRNPSCDHTLPLSSLKDHLGRHDPSLYDIESITEGDEIEITFEGGERLVISGKEKAFEARWVADQDHFTPL